jgi:hypothetical protein
MAAMYCQGLMYTSDSSFLKANRESMDPVFDLTNIYSAK